MSPGPGTPSDELPGLLATGGADVAAALVSMASRHPEGRDADYLAWHALDHEPEIHRVGSLRRSQRLVSTPECRAARLVEEPPYDGVDHVMSYLFAQPAGLAGAGSVARALAEGGRMPMSLPHVELARYDLAGTAAAPRIRAGADVVAWRPALGAFLLVESGPRPAGHLVEVEGVAGVWWYAGAEADTPFADVSGRQLTWLYLDDDPVAVAGRLRDPLEQRWADGELEPLLAAPMRTVVPFEWDRHLP